MSGGRPSVAEALRVHASVICLQHPSLPSLPTARLNKEKKYSSTHQNTDTSFPNQETLTSHLYKPTHCEEMPQQKELHKLPEYRKDTPNSAM